jgi:hypothetical protein
LRDKEADSTSSTSSSTQKNNYVHISVVPNLLVLYKWIDLMYSFNANIRYWLTSPSTFELEVLAYGKTDGGLGD